MISPAQFDEAKTPFMVLAGQKWPVPEFAVRQLREVRGPLIEMNRRLIQAGRELKADTTIDDVVAAKGDAFISLDKDDFDRLIVQPVYWALTRAHTLKFDEFLDWPATEAELVAAWFVVQRQSGVFVQASAGDVPEGEAPAPVATQTGI